MRRKTPPIKPSFMLIMMFSISGARGMSPSNALEIIMFMVVLSEEKECVGNGFSERLLLEEITPRAALECSCLSWAPLVLHRSFKNEGMNVLS
jgi:hypothetical protein